ncbi:unnamed protein product (macronuclear) [Paramecium tetraurelia]|uniref:Uncharacterized protein n=1 Tax=Paramecium tetraurelia TaxID=5888 RepID=A0DI19_PARTE|nr:uncharacterized protein GSPATT00017057001 [Paramecium tetraurelia]CAK82686.1 unnamed protein product [Paramecium tetraurelia]|eukprot:XP_001450083.1 hypothetical protein (macronuclear) [Paramecium tetraurelia strain d4-2]
MSSKNYKLIHQKIPNTTRYRDDQLPINNKYYVRLTQDSTRVLDLIDKDKQIPHLSMIDRFWGQKTQRLPEPIHQEEKHVQLPQEIIPKEEEKKETLPQIEQKTETPLKKTISLKQFKESLLFDERTSSIPKTTIQNHIIEDLIRDSDIFLKKSEMIEQVQSLKRLKVLKKYEANHQNLPGVGKLPYIINDYHSKSTNPGYSRNNKGNFFTR